MRLRIWNRWTCWQHQWLTDWLIGPPQNSDSIHLCFFMKPSSTQMESDLQANNTFPSQKKQKRSLPIWNQNLPIYKTGGFAGNTSDWLIDTLADKFWLNSTKATCDFFCQTQIDLGSDLWVRLSASVYFSPINWCNSGWCRYQLNIKRAFLDKMQISKQCMVSGNLKFLSVGDITQV